MNPNIHLNEYIDFQKYWSVLKRRWIPATAIFASLVSAGIVIALLQEKVYEAEAKLLIKSDRTSELTGFDNGRGDIEALAVDSDPLATEAEVLQSYPIITKVIQELNLQDKEGKLFEYQNFLESLSVKPLTGTDLLEITYTDRDPELAASIVNKTIELYIKDHTLSNRFETSSAKDFIEEQLPQVENSVKEAEANLRDFKNKNRIASLEEETTANINSLSRVSDRIDELEGELESVNARYSTLQNQLNMDWQEASAISALSQSLPVQKALENLQEVEIKLTQKRNYLSENAPQIIALKEEEADLTSLLDRRISQTLEDGQRDLINQVNIFSLGDLKQEQIAQFANLGLRKQGLEKQLVTLRSTYDSYQQKSDSLPEIQEQKRELERRVNAAQSTYETLLAKLQETRISQQQNIGNVRVVANARIPKLPKPSKKKVIVAGAGVAGALLGVIVAFLIDMRDTTLKNSQEIKQILPYPIAGIIPNVNTLSTHKQLFLLNKTPANSDRFAPSNVLTSLLKEVYYNIQTNLKLLNNGGEVVSKVIAVTSAISGEGKSFVSANLAISQAESGQKVLLIDGDLRCPTQHDLWEVDNSIGLTNVLNQEAEWQDILHKVMPNLDVITSGKTAKHPMSLLNSVFMQALLISMSGRYDCIVMDTPPLVGLADSKILGKLADGLLFVIRPGVARYDNIVAAKELLADPDFNVLGVIANGVDLDKELYGYSHYYADKKYLNAG